MRKMKYGIVLLVIILTVITSCATSRRKRGLEGLGNTGKITDYKAFTESVKAFNINRDGFVINRAEIVLEGTEMDGSFKIYAKVNAEGDFFASVRGPLGIELARAMAVGDSVYVINKLGRVVMYGSRADLMKRAGLPGNLIEIITGDLPDDVETIEGTNSYGNGIKVFYNDQKYVREITVDKNSGKISEEIIKTSDGETKYLLRFGNFIDSGNKRFASVVEVESVERMLQVTINIFEVTIGFNDRIEVILPGYRRESL